MVCREDGICSVEEVGRLLFKTALGLVVGMSSLLVRQYYQLLGDCSGELGKEISNDQMQSYLWQSPRGGLRVIGVHYRDI